MNRIKTAIIGLGKIARDQHIPSIAASDAFELVAVASPHSTLEGVPCFQNIEELLKAVPDVAAVALCTTPQVRYERRAVLSSKVVTCCWKSRPAQRSAKCRHWSSLREQKDVTLFASWHSRFAPAVEPARAWLATRRISECFRDVEGGCSRLASGPALDLEGRRARRVRSRHQCVVDPDPYHSRPSDVCTKRSCPIPPIARRRLPRACCSPTRVALRSGPSSIFDKPVRRAGTSKSKPMMGACRYRWAAA